MVQRILNHRPLGEEEHSLETLTRYTFPSSPEKSIAGLIIDELSISPYQPKGEDTDMSLDVCNHILDKWARCLEDQYVSCQPYLINHYV